MLDNYDSWKLRSPYEETDEMLLDEEAADEGFDDDGGDY